MRRERTPQHPLPAFPILPCLALTAAPASAEFLSAAVAAAQHIAPPPGCNACAMVGGPVDCGGSVVSRGLAPLDRTLGVCV